MVMLIDRPDMTLDVYRGRKTTIQQQQHQNQHDTKGIFDVQDRCCDNDPLQHIIYNYLSLS